MWIYLLATALAYPPILGCYRPDQCHELRVKDGWVEFQSFLNKSPLRLGRFQERYAKVVHARELPTKVRRISRNRWLVIAWGFASTVEPVGPAFSAYLVDDQGALLLTMKGDLRFISSELVSLGGTPMLVVVSASSRSWTYLTNIIQLYPKPALVHRSGGGRPKLDLVRQSQGLIDIEMPVEGGPYGQVTRSRLATWS
jgi:hypothetical protein